MNPGETEMRDPTNYDYRHDVLDPEELYARDAARLDVEYWAKFRFAIGIGHYNEQTKPIKGEGLNETVIDSYRELGKAHYQAITNLAEAHLSLTLARFTFPPSNLLNHTMFDKSVADFYYHLGAVLDALARLIYNLCAPDAATHTEKFEGEKVLLRRRINFYILRAESRGVLKGKPAEWGFADFTGHPIVSEIVNIRDVLTHVYKIPSRDWKWPEEAKRQQWLAWPHGEEEFHDYDFKDLIVEVMRKHLDAFIEIFNDIFGRLIERIPTWEANNRVVIE
jgi:hypothetical protein